MAWHLDTSALWELVTAQVESAALGEWFILT